MHGLGTMLFKNGFCYQGMFKKGSREGLGFTYDLNKNKYKGGQNQQKEKKTNIGVMIK